MGRRKHWPTYYNRDKSTYNNRIKPYRWVIKVRYCENIISRICNVIMYRFKRHCHVCLSWYTIFLGNETANLDELHQKYLRAQEKNEKDFWCPIVDCRIEGADELCHDTCTPGRKNHIFFRLYWNRRCKYCYKPLFIKWSYNLKLSFQKQFQQTILPQLDLLPERLKVGLGYNITILR